jgi:signal peptidase I
VLVPLLVLAVLVGGSLVVEPVRVASGSMSPTYSTGDELLVRRSGLGADRPGRGDVVVLRALDGGGLLVKRVAAVAGDRVGIRDGRLVVNGDVVAEPYVDHARVDGTYFGPVDVPAGSVFVLGDNRSDSVDSRDFGPVPWARVEGLVVLRLWRGR